LSQRTIPTAIKGLTSCRFGKVAARMRSVIDAGCAVSSVRVPPSKLGDGASSAAAVSAAVAAPRRIGRLTHSNPVSPTE
jgi:uncharacterized membrane protein